MNHLCIKDDEVLGTDRWVPAKQFYKLFINAQSARKKEKKAYKNQILKQIHRNHQKLPLQLTFKRITYEVNAHFQFR